ncbi:NUDIX domain-containing protein [Chitinibacter sp. SCUT-21]|uniref:NUDIX hydrolase n=1 Tax=Chitinibacter sp. SCUT-21 TaxID=2970891 RepID=UPI0035A6D1C6
MGAAIRAKVVCLFEDNGQYLLAEGFDPTKQQHYLMPIGGGIEFGELSADAVIREVAEEIGVQIESPRLLKVFENLFTFDGVAGHEIVFVYLAQLNAPLQSSIGVESNGAQFKLHWLSVAQMNELAWPVYPTGLFDELVL